MVFFDKKETIEINLDKDKGEWLLSAIKSLDIHNQKTLTFSQLKTDFETQFDDFELFWHSKPLKTLRDFGFLLVL